MLHASKMLYAKDKTLLKNGPMHPIEGAAPQRKGGCHSLTGLESEIPSMVEWLW